MRSIWLLPGPTMLIGLRCYRATGPQGLPACHWPINSRRLGGSSQPTHAIPAILLSIPSFQPPHRRIAKLGRRLCRSPHARISHKGGIVARRPSRGSLSIRSPSPVAVSRIAVACRLGCCSSIFGGVADGAQGASPHRTSTIQQECRTQASCHRRLVQFPASSLHQTVHSVKFEQRLHLFAIKLVKKCNCARETRCE